MRKKVYTKTGDNGSTGLFGGSRVRKHSFRIEAIGTIDELNTILGIAVSTTTDDYVISQLRKVQEILFVVGADLSAPIDNSRSSNIRVNNQQIHDLESLIDQIDNNISQITVFILPGGHITAALVHFARAVCRRAERCCTILSENEDIGSYVLPYLNRLGDFLFVIARFINLRTETRETTWSSI